MPAPGTVHATKANLANFQALDGESVSFAVLKFAPGSVNPPHTHPRGAELLYLLEGVLEVAFIDTKNELFTKTIHTGDMFIFPKGLVHYQYNRNHQFPAVAVSAFGSADAGTVSLPVSVFVAGIDDIILAKSFKTDVFTIEKIRIALAHS